MAKTVNQKIKLLRILEILRMYSDEDNPMTTKEIISKLNEQGIECARKSLYDDIDILNEYGYEILCIKSTQNRYYIVDRTFDIPELKILLDAVQSASFITEKKTKDLVCKVANLAGSHRADLLLENIVCFDTNKYTNESIYYSVDTIDRAIVEKKKISFLYFDYDLNGNRVYRKDKERYVVNPVALIFSENNYYLTCYNDKYQNLSNYRVDRMDMVDETADDIVPAECVAGFDIHKHQSQAFSMFAGDLEDVTLRVKNDLIDVILDKFGQKTIRKKVDDTHFEVKVKVQVSPTFFAWCSTFGDKLKILFPPSVIKNYLNAMQKSMNQYK